jgi:hypothetical protein
VSRPPIDEPEAATRREAPAARQATPVTSEPIAPTAFDPTGDRFEIGVELGRGGMGRVLAANDRALARDVAIKQVLTDDDMLLARFEREVRITAQLEHPSIVPIHDAGRDRNGRPYYVMRRLRGVHLSDRIKATTTTVERLALVPNVLSAVDAAAYAHARKIIHRDIKPANILVGQYGETLLIDWGLARELAELDVPSAPPGDGTAGELTRAGHVFGTPGYMAPEQARGETTDARADVYALGATLLHVLTGTAQHGASATEWIEQARAGTVQITPISDEVPRELVAIIAKAMAPEATARYCDAGELAADLRAFLAGQLVAAHRYTVRDMIARFLRKHRLAISIATIALLAFAVFGAISIRNIVAERDRADTERANAERARAIASDRADIMLLDRAAVLARMDPTRTVALLRTIAPSSPHLPRARDVAVAAAGAGIERGVKTGIGWVTVLLFTPDGKSVVAAGERDGVHVIDVASGALKRWPLPEQRANTAVLLDNDRLVISTSGEGSGLYLLDLRTGERRTLAAEPQVTGLWQLGADRIRYFSATLKSVVDLTISTGASKVIAKDVVSALHLDAEHFVVIDATSLRLITRDRDLVLSSDAAIISGALAASQDGSRFVATTNKFLVEFDRDGRELQRWTLRVFAPTYRENLLFGISLDGAILRLSSTPFPVGRLPPGVMNRSLSTDLVAGFLSTSSGSVVLVDLVTGYTLTREHPETRSLAISRHHLATATRDGMVRWLDLRHVMPESFKIGSGVGSCQVTPTHLYLTTLGSVIEIERATGNPARSIKTPIGVTCAGMVGSKLVAEADGKLMIIDFDTGNTRQYPAQGHFDPTTNRIVLARDHELLEIDVATGTERVLFAAPSKIQYWATHGRWAYAMLLGTAYRYDRETQSVAQERGINSDLIAPASDGTMAFVRGGALYRWDGTSTRFVQPLPRGTPKTLVQTEGAVSIHYNDNSLWYVTDRGVFSRFPLDAVRFAGFGPRHQALRFRHGHSIVRQYIATGETSSLEAPVTFARYGDRNGAVLITTVDRMLVAEEHVPADPAELHRWIDATTNAAIDDATGALIWREGPR